MEREKNNRRQITFTHKLYLAGQLTPDDVCLTDIAKSLSMHVRFNGFGKGFYTVAEHSALLATKDCFPGDPRWKLLHDAAEAYLTDIPTPVKFLIPQIYEIEDRMTRVIGQRFGLPEWSEEIHKIIKPGDIELRNSEALQLGLGDINMPWGNKMSDVKHKIYCFDPDMAFSFFMKVAHSLGLDTV